MPSKDPKLTNHRQPSPWAFTLFGLGACGAFLGTLALIPPEEPELRTALVGVLVAAGYASISRWIGSRVDEVHDQVTQTNAQIGDVAEKVNGRMSELIEALRDAERRAAEATTREARLVSRETKRRRDRRRGKNAP